MPQQYLRLPVDVLRKQDSSDYCLFCLPSGGRDVLLAMAERMLWDIYVNEDGTKAALSDSERAIVDDTIRGLIMACDFATIATALDNIATALDSMSVNVTCAPDVNVTCGSGSDFIVYPGPGLPPVINPGPLPDGDGYDDPLPWPPEFPTTPIDPEVEGPPAGWEDWETYDTDACRAANAVVEYAYQWARQNYDFWAQDVYTLAQLVVVVVNILTLGWAVLFSRALIVKMATVAYKMKDSFTLAGIAEFFASCMDYIQDNRQELVCSIYSARVGGSDGMNDFIANIFEWAAGTAAYVADAPLITELLGYFFPPSLFGAAMVSGIGYTGVNAVSCENCDSNGPPGIESLLLIKVPLTGTYTISESTGTVSSTVSVSNDVVHMSTYGTGNVYRFSVNTPVDTARLLSEHGVTLNVTHRLYCAVVSTEIIQITPGRYSEVVLFAGTNSSGMGNGGYAADGPLVLRYKYVSGISLQQVYDWATENGGHSAESGVYGAPGSFVQWGHSGTVTGPITADLKLESYWYLSEI